MADSKEATPDVTAGGVVVIRDGHVLLVHRPRYQDWSLPKGKVDSPEILPVTAVRECDEETGYGVFLGPYLGADHYAVPEGNKVVHYWSAQVREEVGFAPDEEVDEIAWVQLSEARETLTYPEDWAFVEQARDLPVTHSLLVLRHAKAMKRSDYRGKLDGERPLSGKGRRQSKFVVDALDAYGITRIVSSSMLRCQETVKKYSKYADIDVELFDSLSESGHEKDPKSTRKTVAEITRDLRPTVLCSHRPVIPTIMETIAHELGLSREAQRGGLWDEKIPPASFFAIHRASSPSGKISLISIERHDIPEI